jgi:para-aminobenzoate synthetase component I
VSSVPDPRAHPAEPTPWVDPAAVCAAVAARHPAVFWLDAGPDADAGWSWVGWGTVVPDDEEVRGVGLDGFGHGPPDAAGPFRGGWVGWMGYELGAHRAGAPIAPSDPDAPSSMWLRVHGMAAFDHARRRAWALGDIHPDLSAARETSDDPGDAPSVEPGVARARHDPDEYAELIERCRDAIREGDAYQLCLTTRFEVEGDFDPLVTYAALRRRSPSHHGGLIRAGDVALLSSSPERFLEVDDGMVRTHPIKGTRPRGADAEADAALAAELESSPKERAENVMIVDLMRNDLARVCDPGTVAVDRLLEVESYPSVHQLVSTVTGRLRAGTTVGDLWDAAFPAGSMTGAPKLSAMTILNALERRPRGVFAGAFGRVGADGALDLAMVIRSIVVHPSGAYVGAGGGITWGSEALAEVAEVGIKATAPLAALGAQLPPGW